MTLPQLVATLDAVMQLRIETAIMHSDAVYAGVVPTVAKEGADISRKWRRQIEQLIREHGTD